MELVCLISDELVDLVFGGVDVFVHERLESGLVFDDFRAVVKIHFPTPCVIEGREPLDAEFTQQPDDVVGPYEDSLRIRSCIACSCSIIASTLRAPAWNIAVTFTAVQSKPIAATIDARSAT